MRELLSPYETPSKIPHNFLKNYVIWRRTKNWDKSKHKNNPKPPTDRTINKELQDIQSWINWCIDEKYVGSYLMKDIKVDYQRIDNKKTIEKNPSFTYEDWMKLVVYMRTWIKTEITLKGNEKKNMFYRKVTRLLLLILGNTGMRLHESLSLTWRDVEDKYYVTLYGKNLGDEIYRTGANYVGGTWLFTSYGAPMEYGLEAGVRW